MTAAIRSEGVHATVTICIPTYNRAARLAMTVDGILEQIEAEGAQDRIDVVISDNASDDDTGHRVAEVAARHSARVRYHRLASNVGFSRNAVNAVRCAEGEFIALAGDDDPFRPGAIRMILDSASSGHDIVLFNSSAPAGRPLPATLPIPDALASVERLGPWHLSFIANAMSRRALFLRCFDEELLGSVYVHAGVLLRALGQGSCVFMNFATVAPDDRLRDWRTQQPLYSGVDMVRLLTDEVFVRSPASRWLVWRTYWVFVKSVPRAVLGARRGRILTDAGNRYADLAPSNVRQCYRASMLFQALATLLLTGANMLAMSSTPRGRRR